MLKLIPAFVLCLGALAIGCGADDEPGSFDGVANLNGTDYAVASDCVLAQADDLVLLSVENLEGAVDFYGFSVSWSRSVVLTPGNYDVTTESMNVRFKRSNPANPDGGLSSTVGEGTVVFEQLDEDSLVSGRLVGLRMERDAVDDQNVFVVDGTFTCRP